MKSIIVSVVVLLTSLLKCGGLDKELDDFAPMGCSVKATVVDFKGLDGCGMTLVLDDGTRLNPEKRVYVKAPDYSDDPLYYFVLIAGEKVQLSYTELHGADICPVGKTVFVTCITKVGS